MNKILIYYLLCQNLYNLLFIGIFSSYFITVIRLSVHVIIIEFDVIDVYLFLIAFVPFADFICTRIRTRPGIETLSALISMPNLNNIFLDWIHRR